MPRCVERIKPCELMSHNRNQQVLGSRKKLRSRLEPGNQADPPAATRGKTSS